MFNTGSLFNAGRDLFVPFFIASSLLTSAAVAQTEQLDARYVVSMSGNIVAQLDFAFADNGSSYAIDLNARVTGLGQFVASGSATGNASGRSTANSLSGEDFLLQTRTGDGHFDIAVTYQSGNVNSFVVDPPLPLRIDRVPLERNQLTGVNDMLSAFIIKAGELGPPVCNRRLKIFNGTERFDLVMRYASMENATSARTGYQGPVVLCQLDYQPISGHFTTSEVTTYLQNSDRILIWYAPVEGSNIYIPYRVLIGTAIGDLSMVLTRLS